MATCLRALLKVNLARGADASRACCRLDERHLIVCFNQFAIIPEVRGYIYTKNAKKVEGSILNMTRPTSEYERWSCAGREFDLSLTWSDRVAMFARQLLMALLRSSSASLASGTLSIHACMTEMC